MTSLQLLTGCGPAKVVRNPLDVGVHLEGCLDTPTTRRQVHPPPLCGHWKAPGKMMVNRTSQPYLKPTGAIILLDPPVPTSKMRSQASGTAGRESPREC